MSIQDILGKLKGILSNNDVFIALLVVLVAVASFGLGRASVVDEMPLQASISTSQTVTKPTKDALNVESAPTAVPLNEPAAQGPITYVASKSGTKYHLPWCPGAAQMKEENKIFFNSKEEAEIAGYTPAANCKGI